MYFNEMEMLSPGVDSVEANELDCNYPHVFKKFYSLDKKVIVRSDNNVELFRDEF